jgi:hypothetical protein
MTVENNDIIYKIEVSGIESYTQELPSTITSNFVLDEIVTGVTSGATAVVDQATTLIDTAIRIRTKSGFFIENEELTGSVTGAATKISSTEVVNAPYENTAFDITGGVWTLLSDGDLLTKMSDPIEKINISKGGNLASGYSFGFQVTNFEFAKALQTDGVYFRNRKCVLYLGTVSGGITYTEQWTGAIESFTDVDEDTVSFKCGDLTKQNVTNVGSEKVPIALNRNYNCKLALQGEKKDNFIYVKQFLSTEKSSYVSNKNVDENGATITLTQSQEIQDLIDSGDFTNIIVTVVIGGGAGNTYNVVRAENQNPSHLLYLDTEDLSEIALADDLYNVGSSIITLKKFEFLYNLSENSVNNIHETKNINTEKPITIKDGISNFIPSGDSYSVFDSRVVTLANVIEEDKILVRESNNSFNEIFTGNISGGEFSASAFASIIYNKNDSNQIIEFGKKYDDTYYRPISILIKNAIISESDPTYDPLSFTTNEMINFLEVEHYNYSMERGVRTIINRSEGVMWYDGSKKTIETVVSAGSEIDHYDLEVNFTNWESFKSLFSITGIPDDNDIVDSIYAKIRFIFEQLPSSQGGIGQPRLTRWDDEYFSDTSNWIFDIAIEGFKEIPVDNISIGCNGENVQSAQGIIDGFENVPDTIQYLLTDHYDKDIADIDTASFTEAQDNFSMFINDPVRNAAHQIVDQTDGNTLLKDILFAHHLGMFIDHSGQYYLENWLPKSIVFGFKEADTAYNETNTISIKPIKRDTLNNVVSDYQFKMDLSEATGDYNRTLRVKNPNEDTFNFARDIEGVDEGDTALAFSAWQLAKAGYNRVTNLTQTEKSSNWHKLAFSDGTGTSEAIAFIRNQLAHVNREHEYITFTVPYNTTNLAKELLSFISIQDELITDNEARNGWIVERRLNLKNDTITWKMLLDISKYDPFLFQVNVWKDGDFVTNVKTEGANPTNLKSNGTGT